MKITVQDVCEAQQRIIELKGGTHGIRDIGLVESAVKGIYQTFDSKELYPTTEDKASFLCFSFIKHHAFVDGNKRIGISIMQSFLLLNNYHICVTDDEIIDLALGVAESKYDIEDIKTWIISHKI